MGDVAPLISIVVPAPPGAEVRALKAIKELQYFSGGLELIVVRGQQPSLQRNRAVEQARGEWIYFLDDDACPGRENLESILTHLSDPKMAGVGGPSLCPEKASEWQKAAAIVQSSFIAFGPSHVRYEKSGRFRESGEKELILCNLLLRRSAFLNAGGFNETLYPNEENALMDKIISSGGKLYYDPDFSVERFPRPDLKSFWRMVVNYGRGRSEQFRAHPSPGSGINFVPALFCIYLLAWVFLPLWMQSLLIAYLLLLLGHALVWSVKHPVSRAIKAAFLVVVTHLGYGFGLWKGVFTRLRPPSSVAVHSIEKINLSP